MSPALQHALERRIAELEAALKLEQECREKLVDKNDALRIKLSAADKELAAARERPGDMMQQLQRNHELECENMALRQDAVRHASFERLLNEAERLLRVCFHPQPAVVADWLAAVEELRK